MKEGQCIWCDNCKYEFAEVKFEDKDLCSDCFIEEITDESGEIYTYTVTNYVMGGEHIGTEEEFDDVVKIYANYVGAELIEQD